MRIKGMVEQIASSYATRDPLSIAHKKGIVIFYEDFKNIWGYFNTSRRIQMIHVNSNLDESMQRFVVAHELGHSYLHPKMNVPFLRANTFQVIDKIEREANHFAVELLIPDELLRDGVSIYEAARQCGVPSDIAHLKRIARR